MEWAFFCCVDLDALEKQWSSSLKDVRQAVPEKKFPEQAEHWALPDRRLMTESFLPQVDYLQSKFGPDAIVSELFGTICAFLDIEKYEHIRPAERRSKFNQWLWGLGIQKSDAMIRVDDFYRLFDLYKGLFYLSMKGPVNSPMQRVILHCYFPDYLKYFTPIRNHRRYDTDNRKNYMREILPDGLEKMTKPSFDWYHFNNLCDFPLQMDPSKIRELWKALDEVSKFWDDFKMTETGPDPDASSELSSTIRSGEEPLYEGKRRDSYEIIQQFIEARSPQSQKYANETYSRFAAEQIRKIAEIAAYAMENNLSLVQYFI
jgi:hypothetical protein